MTTHVTVSDSMSTNLVGRLRNTRLPATHGLLPVLEAVVNSIHAIEEADLPPNRGRILVDVSRESILSFPEGRDGKVARGSILGFKVTDNGIGFTDANMRSFRTLDSDYKIDMGGRGVGRLLWLNSLWQKSIDGVDLSRRSGVDLTAWQWARSRRRDSRRRCG